MQLGPWMAMTMVVAVPLLMQLDKARSLLIDGPLRQRAWLFLGTMGALGAMALLGAFPINVRTGPAVLVTVPALQALTFVAAHRVFFVATKRRPVSLRQAQIAVSGTRYLWDLLFWVVLSFGLIVAAALACAHFDVELPTRGR